MEKEIQNVLHLGKEHSEHKIWKYIFIILIENWVQLEFENIFWNRGFWKYCFIHILLKVIFFILKKYFRYFNRKLGTVEIDMVKREFAFFLIHGRQAHSQCMALTYYGPFLHVPLWFQPVPHGSGEMIKYNLPNFFRSHCYACLFQIMYFGIFQIAQLPKKYIINCTFYIQKCIMYYIIWNIILSKISL